MPATRESGTPLEGTGNLDRELQVAYANLAKLAEDDSLTSEQRHQIATERDRLGALIGARGGDA
jgi:hypothetical protein